jgi:hypothetical protein
LNGDYNGLDTNLKYRPTGRIIAWLLRSRRRHFALLLCGFAIMILGVIFANVLDDSLATAGERRVVPHDVHGIVPARYELIEGLSNPLRKGDWVAVDFKDRRRQIRVSWAVEPIGHDSEISLTNVRRA